MEEKNLVEKNCILLDQDVHSFKEVIQLIGAEFEKAEIVKPSYVEAVVAREKVFPTGLAADGHNIAIPHTDPEHVLRPGMGVVVTKEPIEVSMMGSPDIKLQSKIFFPLAMEHPKKQLDLLRQLMNVFKTKEDLDTISSATTPEEVLAVTSKISSAMVGERIVELLEEHGYEVEIQEVNPGMVKGAVANNDIDLIAFTSPIDPVDAEGIPQINSVGLLTGLDEETFLDAALAALKEMGK